jgi:hypothetical protein
MTLAQVSIILGGILSGLMAVFHIRFYATFGWMEEFETLSVVSRKIIFTIHLALLLLFFCFTVVSLANSSELSQARGVSFTVCLVYSLFWIWRLVWQCTRLVPTKGRPKSAFLRHYVLIFVFALLCACYAAPLAARLF